MWKVTVAWHSIIDGDATEIYCKDSADVYAIINDFLNTKKPTAEFSIKAEIVQHEYYNLEEDDDGK